MDQNTVDWNTVNQSRWYSSSQKKSFEIVYFGGQLIKNYTQLIEIIDQNYCNFNRDWNWREIEDNDMGLI